MANIVYKFKATIPYSKVFMREFAVRPDMNLFRFNRYILSELCFSTDQMVIYRAFNDKGVCTGRYGLFDLGDGSLDNITFADIISRGQVKIEFVYNLRPERIINLEFEGEMPEEPRMSYPCIVGEKGHNPSQFADKYEDYMYESPVRGAKLAAGDLPDDDDDEDEDDDDEVEEIYDGGLDGVQDDE